MSFAARPSRTALRRALGNNASSQKLPQVASAQRSSSWLQRQQLVSGASSRALSSTSGASSAAAVGAGTYSSQVSLPQSFASVLPNHVDTASESFLENKKEMDRLVAQLDADTSRIGLGGTEKARARHLKRGKMLPRDR